MPNLARRWTRDEVQQLPDDGKRYELLDGELLVSPSPIWLHQRAVLALYDRLRPYVEEHRLGWTGVSPADLDLRSGQLLQPDLFVTGLMDDGRMPLQWSDAGIPLLVVEVLSPSTALYDRNRKRRKYQEAGVEYWIVDTDARLIERWQPADSRPEILTEQIEWAPVASSPLVIGLVEYFRRVWAE